MTRLLALLLFFALVFGDMIPAQSQSSVPPIQSTYQISAGSGPGPDLPLTGQSSCSLVVNTQNPSTAGIAITPQLSSDHGRTWVTASTIGGGAISTYGTYTGGIATTALTDFRFIYTLTSGSLFGNEICNAATPGGGSVMSVGATSPITSTGGANPVIGCPTCGTSSTTVTGVSPIDVLHSGGNYQVSCPECAALNVANTFTADQTVMGNVIASGSLIAGGVVPGGGHYASGDVVAARSSSVGAVFFSSSGQDAIDFGVSVPGAFSIDSQTGTPLYVADLNVANLSPSSSVCTNVSSTLTTSGCTGGSPPTITAASPLVVATPALNTFNFSCPSCAVNNADNHFTTDQTITGTLNASDITGGSANIVATVQAGDFLDTAWSASSAVCTDAFKSLTTSGCSSGTVTAVTGSGNIAVSVGPTPNVTITAYPSFNQLQVLSLAPTSLICTDGSANLTTSGCPSTLTGLTAGENIVLGTGPSPSVATTNSPTFFGTMTATNVVVSGLAPSLCVGTDGSEQLVSGSNCVASVQAGSNTVVTIGPTPTVSVTAHPSFAQLTVTGLTAGSSVCTDGSSNLTTSGCASGTLTGLTAGSNIVVGTGPTPSVATTEAPVFTGPVSALLYDAIYPSPTPTGTPSTIVAANGAIVIGQDGSNNTDIYVINTPNPSFPPGDTGLIFNGAGGEYGGGVFPYIAAEPTPVFDPQDAGAMQSGGAVVSVGAFITTANIDEGGANTPIGLYASQLYTGIAQPIVVPTGNDTKIYPYAAGSIKFTSQTGGNLLDIPYNLPTPASGCLNETSQVMGVVTCGTLTGLTAGSNIVVGAGATPSVAVTQAPTFTGTASANALVSTTTVTGGPAYGATTAANLPFQLASSTGNTTLGSSSSLSVTAPTSITCQALCVTQNGTAIAALNAAGNFAVSNNLYAQNITVAAQVLSDANVIAQHQLIAGPVAATGIANGDLSVERSTTSGKMWLGSNGTQYLDCGVTSASVCTLGGSPLSVLNLTDSGLGASSSVCTNGSSQLTTSGCTSGTVTGLTAGSNMVVGTGPTPSVATTAAPTFTTVTASTGVSLTANPGGGTAATFNDYEVHTWTPADASGASLTITNNEPATYTKIGNRVCITMDISYPATADATTAAVTLPFTAMASGSGVPFFPLASTVITAPTSSVSPTASGADSPSDIRFYALGSQVANSVMSGSRLIINGCYAASV